MNPKVIYAGAVTGRISMSAKDNADKWDGTHIWNREVNRVRHVYPHRSPYVPRARLLHEFTTATRHYRYCIADRDGLPVLLYTSYAEAQNACEHININMAKEVLS